MPPSPRLADAGAPASTAKPAPHQDEAAARAALVPIARAFEKVLCPRDRCATNVTDFGRDGQGQDLFVVELYGEGEYLTAPRPREAATGAGAKDEDQAPSGGDGTGEKAEAEGGGEDCTPAEYHLMARKGRKVRKLALLAKSCNKAPDFPVAGDSVDVDKEKRQVGQSWGGGSAVWTSSSIDVGVDPLRLIGFSVKTSSRVDLDDETDRSWDWDDLAGSTMTAPWDCQAVDQPSRSGAKRPGRSRAAPNEGDPHESDAGGAQGRRHLVVHATLIPDVEVPADFVARSWRTTRLGRCAATLDFTIHGGPSTEADASARAMVASRTLFVEVSDDRFVGPGKSWVTDDHLELWLGKSDERTETCEPLGEHAIAQWGIRVADGAVFSAHGAPAPLPGVERTVAAGTARFKIPLPADQGDRITVAYSDSDDGRKQKWLIATSELRFGDPATLGETFAVATTDAKCVIQTGALVPVRMPLEPSEGPVLQPP